MASTSQCPYCGSTVTSNEKFCGNCGAPNEGYIADTKRQIFLPKTIDELKEYCAERGMPLLKMRFFIGEDYRRPKAFGIYRDGNEFVVYKNKANGERAVRYRGPDEAHAVNELFLKLLDECHHRGIYPDGKLPEPSRGGARRRSRMSTGMKAVLIAMVFFFGLTAVLAAFSMVQHRKDGYYSTGDTLYYRYGSSWYMDSGYDDWVETDSFPADDYGSYYVGNSYNDSWDGSDFMESDTWDSLQDSGSDSDSDWDYDYDDWDSGDTDWDSDW